MTGEESETHQRTFGDGPGRLDALSLSVLKSDKSKSSSVPVLATIMPRFSSSHTLGSVEIRRSREALASSSDAITETL